jgi:O-antigen ligase
VLLLAAVLVFVATPTARRAANPPGGRRAPAALLLAVATAVAVAAVVGTGPMAARWRQYLASRERSGPNPRVLVWRIGWATAREAGAFGSGPGSFKLRFPHSPHMIRALYSRWIVHEHTPGGRVSIWSQAHEDYLQTVIEWGWVGAAAWAGLLAGGVWGLIRAGTRPPRHAASTGRANADRLLARCALVALAGVAIHAAIDFPLQIASIQLYVAVLLGIGWAGVGGRGGGSRRCLDDSGPLSDAPAPSQRRA